MRAHDIDMIRATYDRIADAYLQDRDQFASRAYLNDFVEYLPVGGRILDLGCGGGVPVSAYLANRGFGIHGFDLSERMVALARKHVPSGIFEVGNMLNLVDGQYAVDGVVSFYAIFHTPRDRHADLFRRFASFLPPRGALLVTMGASDWEGSEPFHGSPMIWSHYGADRNTHIVESAGFEIVRDEIDCSGAEEHQIIVALKR